MVPPALMSTSTRLPSPAIWKARQAPRIVTVLPLPARLASWPWQSPTNLVLLPAKLTAGSAARAVSRAVPSAPAVANAAKRILRATALPRAALRCSPQIVNDGDPDQRQHRGQRQHPLIAPDQRSDPRPGHHDEHADHHEMQ